MLVDGKKFKTYELDNKETIKNRISVNYETLPKYTILEEKKDNITVHTLLDYMKNSKNIRLAFSKSKFNISLEEFCKLWYIYLINKKNPYEVLAFEEQLKEVDIPLQRIEIESELFEQSLKVEFNLLKQDVERQLDVMKKLEDKDPIYSTLTEIRKTITEVEFVVDYDIYQLFDDLEMNRNIPFCTINKFYKILKDFIPPEQWRFISEKNNILIMKVLNVVNETPKNIKNPNNSYYSNVEIRFESSFETAKREMIENRLNVISNINEQIITDVNKKLRGLDFPPTSKVFMRLESIITKDLNEELLIKRILDMFPTEILNWTSQQVSVNCEFLVPDFRIEYPILLDLITNNPVYSQVVAIDEHSRIQNPDYGIPLAFINTNTIFNMDSGVVNPSNQKLINKDDKLKPNTYYIQVYIANSKNVFEVERFKLIFCRLLTLYNFERKNVIKKYNEYMDFDEYLNKSKSEEDVAKRLIKKKKLLKDVDANLFLPNYARMCQHPPQIISEFFEEDDEPENVTKLKDEGTQVAVFPKTSLEGKQYYFACTKSKRYKYISLTENKLENRDKFPIIPCCLTTDQSKRKNTNFRKYYDGDDTLSEFIPVEKTIKGGVIISDNILDEGRLGELPHDVKTFFNVIDSTNTYLRKGIKRSTDSILNCLSVATKQKVVSRQKLIEFMEDNDINLFQEMSDYNIEMIKQDLLNNDKYIDPKLYINLLQKYFKCYIYIFVRNEVYPNGVLSCPYHHQYYLQQPINKTYPVILIYEHFGVKTDNAKYPQCELITQKKDTFNQETELIQRIKYTFNEMYEGIKDDIIDISKIVKSKVVGIGLDYYGKTRFLTVKNNKNTPITILTNPLPNIDLPITSKYESVDDKLAKQLLEFEKCEYYPVELNNYIIGYKTPTFYIPIKPIKSSSSSLYHSSLIYSPVNNDSELSEFLQLDKLSRILTEYMLYLFSIYYYEGKQSYEEREIDQYFIYDFVKSNIIINKSFKYGPITRVFSLESNVLKNKKLVVHSELVLKKLVYVLQLRLRDNKNEVVNYSDYKYIQNYYNDIRDFKRKNTENIIYGQPALIKWIDDKRNNYKLFNNIRPQLERFEKEILNKANANEGIVVLLFTANWSKSSKMMENRIFDIFGKKKKYTDLSVKYPNIKFIYINVDTNKELVYRLKITTVPYFIILQDEEIKEKIKGSDNVVENSKRLEYVLNKLIG